MPPNCVSVTRPGIFGNPFTVADAIAAGYRGTAEELAAFAVRTFKTWLLVPSERIWFGHEADKRRAAILEGLERLRGKDVACWCPEGSPCHGDVLLELANSMPADAWVQAFNRFELV